MTTLIKILIGACIGIATSLSFGAIKKAILVSKESGQVVEQFQMAKFAKGFDLLNPVLWVKSIFEIIDLRKFIIYAVIVGCVLVYGYNTGYQNRPVSVNLGYGKEAIINLGNGEYMHITKEGEVHIQPTADPKDPTILRSIKIKDIPNLAKILSPIGLQFRPIIVVGYGVGTGGDNGLEVGAGVSFFRYWKMRLDAFATQKGVYLGTSYQITDSAGIGIGAGVGYKGDTRVIVYGSIKF